MTATPPPDLEHLLTAAPVGTCSACGRRSVAEQDWGKPCLLSQPDGTRCKGRISHPIIERDVLIFGTAFLYDGQPLDPTKLVTYRRKPDGVVVEAEEYEEWRLTGQPDGHYPPYDFTACAREHIDAVRALWFKIQAGERNWTDAKFVRRHVTVTRTAWTEVSDDD